MVPGHLCLFQTKRSNLESKFLIYTWYIYFFIIFILLYFIWYFPPIHQEEVIFMFTWHSLLFVSGLKKNPFSYLGTNEATWKIASLKNCMLCIAACPMCNNCTLPRLWKRICLTSCTSSVTVMLNLSSPSSIWGRRRRGGSLVSISTNVWRLPLSCTESQSSKLGDHVLCSAQNGMRLASQSPQMMFFFLAFFFLCVCVYMTI